MALLSVVLVVAKVVGGVTMDQLVPPALGWLLMVYGVCMLIVAAWREHVDTRAMLRRMDADQERWAAHRQRQQRLAEIRDRLYVESLLEERPAQELEVRPVGRARAPGARDPGPGRGGEGGRDRCAGLS
jgi:hypothetical protein